MLSCVSRVKATGGRGLAVPESPGIPAAGPARDRGEARVAKPGKRRDSYTVLRETLRWQVAVVLAGIVLALTLALSLLNSRLGFGDTALLAWIICGLSAACLLALLKLPRDLGATIFFEIGRASCRERV